MAKKTTKILFYIFLSLFVTHCHTSAQVTVPDGFATIKVANEVPNADGLAFDSEGNLYAASERWNYKGGVYKIDSDGIATPFVTNLNMADGLMFHPETGFIYVSEEVAPGRVSRVYTSGNATVVVPESKVNRPEGLAINPANGNLYIAEDMNPGRILIYNLISGDVTTFVSGLNRPEGIAFDDLGNLYVAETATNQILKIAPDGAVAVLVPPSAGIIEPDNVLYNSAYNVLFVSEDASPDGRILIVDPDTGFTTTFAKGLSYPQGMTFDAAGSLYVSEQGLDRIIKITGFKCCSAIINNSAKYTRRRRVKLRILYERDVTHIRFSNNGTKWTSWKNIKPIVRRRLKRGKGLKTIYIQCSKSGEACEPSTASITRIRMK